MQDTQETQKVYLGNGIEKEVVIDEKYHHYLDIDKLEKIINENLGERIVVGCKEDWYFTAQDVTLEDIKEIKDGNTLLTLYSCWDKMIVKIIDEAGDTKKEIDCTLNIEKYPAQLAFSAGYNYTFKRIDVWFNKKLYHECLHKWKYEIIKDFADEVNLLIDKYEQIHKNVNKYSSEGRR